MYFNNSSLYSYEASLTINDLAYYPIDPSNTSASTVNKKLFQFSLKFTNM